MKTLRMLMKNPAFVAACVVVVDQAGGRLLVGMPLSRKISDGIVSTFGGNRTLVEGGTT